MQAEVKRLVDVRRQIGEYDEAYEKATSALKLERDALQTKITEELKNAGVLSQRFQEATVTVTRAVRKTVQVLDETKAVAALKAKGLTDYVSETINDLFWNSAAKEIAKQGKTDIDGLVIQGKEYLSVRESGKEERRKVTTD
jgi:predicted RNA-binding protein Jag